MPVLFDGLGDLDEVADAPPAGAALFDGLGDLDAAEPIPHAPVPVAEDDEVVYAAEAPVVADDLPVIAGVGEAEPKPRARKSTTVKAVSGGAPARKAVTDALALLGALGAPVPGGQSGTPMLPTARVRTALDELAGAGSIEALTATQPDLKRLTRDACDWAGAFAGSRGTGAVVKAVGRVLTGTDDRGASTYPQAVEMISFAAACAPLLEPDRLVRLIGEASNVACAYAPIRYTAALAGQLQLIMRGYAPQRREQLLVSLWHTAHTGRWGNAIGGVTPDGPRRRRRRDEDDEEARELRELHERQLRLVFGSATAKPQGSLVVDALRSGALVYSPQATDALRRTEAAADELAELARIAKAAEDSDVHILVAHVPGIPPDIRPQSPIPALVNALAEALGDGDEDADLAALAEHLPPKPREWVELYPKASLKLFPIPAAVLALNGVTLEGTGGEGQPAAAKVELLRNPHTLKLNGDEMGNCTFSVYRSHCERGDMVIGRVYQNSHVFNFSIVPSGRGRWHVREINSKANAGNVPAEIRTGIEQLAASVGA